MGVIQKSFAGTVLFIMLLCTGAKANGVSDSLQKLLLGHPDDTAKVELLNRLFKENLSNDIGQALRFAEEASELSNQLKFDPGKAISLNNIGYGNYLIGKENIALVYYLKSLNVCEKYDTLEVEIIANANIAAIFMKQKNYWKTIEYFENALKAAGRVGDRMREASILGNIGVIYYQLGYYARALEYYIKSQKIREEIGDEKGIANVLSNIGIIHAEEKNYTLALEYYNKSLAIREKLDDTKGIAASLINIGDLYFIENDLENARLNYEKALKNARLAGHNPFIASALNNIGGIYLKQGDFDKALENYNNTLEMQKAIGDAEGEISTQNSIGKLYKEKSECEKAVLYFQKSIDMAMDYGMKDEIKNNYQDMARCYADMGNYSKAYYYQEQYSILHDTLYTQESQKQIADMQIKYETEKKEKEIQLLTRDAELNELRLNKNKLLIYFISVAFILLLITALVLYNRFRLKKKANKLLSEQKNEIEIQKKEITDSIRYASRIQSAILIPERRINEILKEYFILYKPRDIVSGDFYWINKKENKTVIVVADCTGHGVPGAFMSVMGVTFLNEIITRPVLPDTAQILELLRANVINALHQTGKTGESRDGMDMSIIIIDSNLGQIQFSGAHNPLYVIKREGEDRLHEIKGDRMPIGYHQKLDKPFNMTNYKYESGDMLYMFSDGYADQFGGVNREKFKYKQFRELLISVCDLNVDEQKERLDLAFNNWKSDEPQVDDVLVMGIRMV